MCAVCIFLKKKKTMWLYAHILFIKKVVFLEIITIKSLLSKVINGFHGNLFLILCIISKLIFHFLSDLKSWWLPILCEVWDALHDKNNVSSFLLIFSLFGTFIEVCHILAFLTSSMIFCIYACDTFRVLWLAYLLWDRAKGRKGLAEWICLHILKEIRRLRTS